MRAIPASFPCDQLDLACAGLGELGALAPPHRCEHVADDGAARRVVPPAPVAAPEGAALAIGPVDAQAYEDLCQLHAEGGGLDVFSTDQTASVWRAVPRTVLDGRRFMALRHRALTGGASTTPEGQLLWTLTGRGRYRCTKPAEVRFEGRRPRRLEHTATDDPLIGAVHILGRCRQCENCVRAKRALWTYSAIAEIEAAPQTWFVTLTISPSQMARADYSAHLRLSAQGVLDPTPEELQAERWKSLQKELQLWLQRLRKGHRKHAKLVKGVCVRCGRKPRCTRPLRRGERGPVDICEPPRSFRYLATAEHGTESHREHFHLLLHELPGLPIGKRRLQFNWVAGYSTAELVGGEAFPPDKAARYVAKYITKANVLSRIPASHRYGDIPVSNIHI